MLLLFIPPHQAAAVVLGCTSITVQKLAAAGHLTARRGPTPFDRTEVESLPARFIFIAEIKTLTGYTDVPGVLARQSAVGPL